MMRHKAFAFLVTLALPAATWTTAPLRVASQPLSGAHAAGPSVQQQPRVEATGLFSSNKARRGGTLQAAVILEIPEGLHINSNRPTGEFMIPTVVKVTAPRGVRVGAVRYPRANVRKFDFSPDEPLSVFEGFPAVLFDVTVPAAFKDDELELRAEVTYQMCSNFVCYPPATREVKLSIDVVAAAEKAAPVNEQVFGSGKKRKG